MEEFKGTKGEWKCVYGEIQGEDGRSVCEITEYVDEDEHKKDYANAQLIASSPKLLDALQNLVEANINYQGESVMKRIEEAQQAINQALGKE